MIFKSGRVLSPQRIYLLYMLAEIVRRCGYNSRIVPIAEQQDRLTQRLGEVHPSYTTMIHSGRSKPEKTSVYFSQFLALLIGKSYQHR